MKETYTYQEDALLLEGDTAALRTLAQSCPGGVIVNIGCWKGASVAILATANPAVTVLAVDNFRGVGKNPEDIAVSGAELRDECAENLEGLPNVVLLHSDSVSTAKMLCTKVRAVFVDGDHTKDGCLADMEAWWPKIEAGGVMCGHDCVDGFGVPDAIEEFCTPRNLKMHLLSGKCHGFWIIKKGQA